MAELLVHDEDLWTEMQQALRRARDDRQRKSIATPTRATDEVSTPSQPGMAARLLEQASEGRGHRRDLRKVKSSFVRLPRGHIEHLEFPIVPNNGR